MGNTQTVIDYTQRKLREIATECQGKPIPNLYKIDDTIGFGILITEGDLNFSVIVSAYPVEEVGKENFLVKVQAMFRNKPVATPNGYEFISTPIGAIIELDHALYAEDEQQLIDGILQFLDDEAENILCRIMQ